MPPSATIKTMGRKLARAAASGHDNLRPGDSWRKQNHNIFATLGALDPSGDQDFSEAPQPGTLQPNPKEVLVYTTPTQESSIVNQNTARQDNVQAAALESEDESLSDLPLNMMAKNWRLPDKKLQKARMHAASILRRRQTKNSGQTVVPGPRTKAGIPHAYFNSGTIVWRHDTRPCQNPTIPDDDPRVVFENGIKCVRKGRYWVILRKKGKKLYQVPIYTNDGQGLRGYSSEKKKEYFSICPPGHDIRTFVNQSPSNRVLGIEWLDGSNEQKADKWMRSTMVVHPIEVFERDIEEQPTRIVGTIPAGDLTLLQKEAGKHLPEEDEDSM